MQATINQPTNAQLELDAMRAVAHSLSLLTGDGTDNEVKAAIDLQIGINDFITEFWDEFDGDVQSMVTHYGPPDNYDRDR